MEVKYTMALTEAKVEAAMQSRKEGKKVYIVVNKEGDCGLSFEPVEGKTQFCYSNGSQIALDTINETTIAPKEKKTSVKKTSTTKAEKVVQTVNSSKSKQVMAKATKTPAKKTAKKESKGHESVQGKDDIGKATTLFLNKDQWKKFWDKMEKNNVNFREWIKGAALSYIK